jgi:photosystem II stability/assembly factor-like uncharacterized protein
MDAVQQRMNPVFFPTPRASVVAAIGAMILLCALTGMKFIGAPERIISSITQAAPGAAGGPIANETYAWRPVAIGGGGFITGLSIDRSGTTMLARTDVHGAYLWRADLDRWVQLAIFGAMPPEDHYQSAMNEGAYEIVVAPGDPDRLYMAIKGHFYRSDDRGRTWRAPGRGSAPFPVAADPNGAFRWHGAFLAVDPANPDHLLMGTPAAGLWRSVDGAVTWARVASVPAASDGKADAGGPAITVWYSPDGKRAWAASPGHGVFASDDEGATFASAAKGGPVTVAKAAFTRDGALIALDEEHSSAWLLRGGRWTDLTAAHELPAARYVAIATDPASGHVVVADEGGHFTCSIDGGRVWTGMVRRAAVGERDPPWLRVTDQSYFAMASMAFDPKTPGRLWVAAGAGVYRADLGTSCAAVDLKSQTRGIEELVATDTSALPGRAPLFAALDFGIHVKPDLNAFSTGYGPRERVLIAAQQLAASAGNPDFVVTNASDTRTSCCSDDGNSVLAGYSFDAGRTWAKFATLPTPPGTKPQDPWRMAFGTIAVAAGSTDNIVWAPGYDRSPFYTLDRGKSWHRVVLEGEHLPLTGSFGGIFLQRKTLVADPVAPATFYLVHSGSATNPQLAGLWRTTDGGAHWARLFAGEIAPNSRFAAKLRAMPGRKGDLFFTSGFGGGDTRLRRTTDGGAHWLTLNRVTRVDDIAFGKAAPGAVTPTIYLSGQIDGHYGIWRSVDDAQNWQRVADFPMGRLDQVTVIEGDKDVFGRVYVGYEGSGWLYGEPALCPSSGYRQGDDKSCFLVGKRQ